MTQVSVRVDPGPFPFKVVTDSTCDLRHGEQARVAVTCLPLDIQLQGQQFRDWTNLGPESPYNRMREGHQATTTPPTAETFVRVYRTLLNRGAQVLSLQLSGQVFETVNHAREAARHLGAEDRILVVDSQLASAGLAELLLIAVRVRIQLIGCVIGAHVGPGTYGFLTVPVELF